MAPHVWVYDPRDMRLTVEQLVFRKEQATRQEEGLVVADPNVISRLEKACWFDSPGLLDPGAYSWEGYCYAGMVPEEYRSTVSRLGVEPYLGAMRPVVDEFGLHDRVVYVRRYNDGYSDRDIVFHTSMSGNPADWTAVCLAELPDTARVGASSVPSTLMHGESFCRTTQVIGASCSTCEVESSCHEAHFRDQVLHGCAVHGLPGLGRYSEAEGCVSYGPEERAVARDVARWAVSRGRISWQYWRGLHVDQYKLCARQCVQPVLSARARRGRRARALGQGTLHMTADANDTRVVVDSVLLSQEPGGPGHDVVMEDDVRECSTGALVRHLAENSVMVSEDELLQKGWGAAPSMFVQSSGPVYERGVKALLRYFRQWLNSRGAADFSHTTFVVSCLDAAYQTSTYGRLMIAQDPAVEPHFQCQFMLGILDEKGGQRAVEVFLDWLGNLVRVFELWECFLVGEYRERVRVDPFGLPEVPYSADDERDVYLPRKVQEYLERTRLVGENWVPDGSGSGNLERKPRKPGWGSSMSSMPSSWGSSSSGMDRMAAFAEAHHREYYYDTSEGD